MGNSFTLGNANVDRYFRKWVSHFSFYIHTFFLRNRGGCHEKILWSCMSLWTVGWFSYGNYLVFQGQCRSTDIGIYIGMCCILGCSYICLFINWPFIAVMLYQFLDSVKPILPHLPHRKFCDLIAKNSYVDKSEGCVICINEYEDKHIVTELPCGHFYHRNNKLLSFECVISIPRIQTSPVSHKNLPQPTLFLYYENNRHQKFSVSSHKKLLLTHRTSAECCSPKGRGNVKGKGRGMKREWKCKMKEKGK